MSLSKFFESCDIKFDTKQIDYIPDFLINIKRNKCFIIDELPLATSKENGYKFDQIEKSIYSHFYDKFSNVIKKIWLYDDLFFYSELLSKLNMIRCVPFWKFCTYKRLLESDKLVNYKDIQFLNCLSEKNVIDLEYYCINLQIYLTPTYNGTFVYINNHKSYYLFNKILRTEGLILRKI